MTTKLRKYWQVLKATFQEYFVYRLNFLLWRLRAFLLIVVLYFFWQAAIPQGQTIFNYDQAKILTYILGTSIVRSFVLSSRSVDVGGQIASGDLSNFLLKPINYLRFWFVKDMSDKILNLVFSVFEISLLFWLLKPPIIFQKNLYFLLLSLLAVGLGIILYFYISFLLSSIAFWMPESVWPPRFVFQIILEFFAGGLFPLDILPAGVYSALKILPFPYLLFFPLDIYLGKLSFSAIFVGLGISFLWIIIVSQIVQYVFRAGVKNYAAWGR